MIPNVRPIETTDADAIRAAVRRLGDAKSRVTREALGVDEAFRRVEALVFAAGEPVSAEALAKVVPEGTDLGDVLMRVKAAYEGRGVRLVEVAGKWRFETAADLAHLFQEHREEPRKLSRAALETLAIIAYRQPVTRAEIEEIRGVAVSKGTIDVLMEAGWVKIRGRRRTPGRPVTYGTNEAFLEHFGLASLDNLPGKAEMKAAGFLDDRFTGDVDWSPPRLDLEEPMEDEDEADTAFHLDFLGEGAQPR
jgi:segregation and condensation protein B